MGGDRISVSSGWHTRALCRPLPAPWLRAKTIRKFPVVTRKKTLQGFFPRHNGARVEGRGRGSMVGGEGRGSGVEGRGSGSGRPRGGRGSAPRARAGAPTTRRPHARTENLVGCIKPHTLPNVTLIAFTCATCCSDEGPGDCPCAPFTGRGGSRCTAGVPGRCRYLRPARAGRARVVELAGRRAEDWGDARRVFAGASP
eukprot:COSAG06_NODE_450_length_15622_cov_25.221671_6_plen_199_part_00